MSPTAAIIIPCWNGGAFVARAIASAQSQSSENLEVIVIDDGSSDESLEVIKTFGGAVRWVSGPNEGASAARNRGLAMTGADYVLFLDADDYLEPRSMGHWVSEAERTAADIVLGPFAVEFDGNISDGARPEAPVTAIGVLTGWLEGRFTPPCAVLWRRTFLEAIGGWNSTGWDKWALRNDDAELVMRAMLHDAAVVAAEHGCGVYVQHRGPDRITLRSDAAVSACQLDVLESLWRLAQPGAPEVRKGFARAFYRVAYEAYDLGANDTGRAALAHARCLGFKGHQGTRVHRVASSLLGLRLKMRLAAAVRSAIGAA